jgi:allene oxide cyclase
MRKPLFVGSLVLVVIGAALTISFAGTRAVTEPTKIVVFERPLTDKVINTGHSGDSSGDLLTFHNPIYDATNSHQVGHDQGDCIRISPHQGSWECRWLTYITGRGAIMIEGAFFDGRDSTLAITGGTQEFRNARGSLKLAAKGGGYRFVFMLLP